jgi:hypothetical protein
LEGVRDTCASVAGMVRWRIESTQSGSLAAGKYRKLANWRIGELAVWTGAVHLDLFAEATRGLSTRCRDVAERGGRSFASRALERLGRSPTKARLINEPRRDPWFISRCRERGACSCRRQEAAKAEMQRKKRSPVS